MQTKTGRNKTRKGIFFPVFLTVIIIIKKQDISAILAY